MQSFVFLLVAICASIHAQDINSLPECERACVIGVVTAGPSYGCPATDNGQPAPACLCDKTEFAYAIRDCARESCPEGTNITQISEYGLQYCQPAQASASGTQLSALSIFSSAATEAPTGSASTGSETGQPISTIPVVSTLTSDGTTQETTLGSTTLYSPTPGATGNSSTTGGASSSSSSSSTTETVSSTAVTTRPIVSTISESSTTRETTIGSTTEFSSATSSSSQGAGATMAPLRVVPAFVGRQGGNTHGNFGGYLVQGLGWTVAVMGFAQLM
ncbi:unnamed protein product [Discula destructiva]